MSLMIWSSIGINYKSILYWSYYERKRLYYNFKISWSFWGCNRKYKKWGYVLQQDGSTCYTTTGSIFFIIRKANVFLGFPSNSSDLSPIENLWAIIRDKLEDETEHLKKKKMMNLKN